MTPPENDRPLDAASLGARFLAGEEAALDEAMRGHGPQLYALLRRMTRSHEEADDLLQEAFLRAWERRGQLREPEKFAGWLRSIAASAAMDFLRERKRRHLVPLDAAPEIASPERSHSSGLDSERVRALADRLPPRQHEALMLWLSEIPYAEMAAAMGCSEGAAKAHVHQAVGNLRKMMGGK